MKPLFYTVLLSSLITLQHSYAYNTGSDFAELVREHVEIKSPFVDKTMFIRDFISTPLKYMIVTRPRKWGKSVNLNMLHQFLAIEVDHHGNRTDEDSKIYKPVFHQGKLHHHNHSDERYPRLKIADCPSVIEKNQGKWPVLKLDFSKVRFRPNPYDIVFMKYELKQKFLELAKAVLDTDYKYLLSWSNHDRLGLTQTELNSLYYHVDEETQLLNPYQLIHLMVKALYNYFDKKPVYVLIDGYDHFVNQVGFEDEVSPTLLNYTLEMFETTYSVLEHPELQSKIKKVLMTGTLPFLQTRSRSTLNTYHLISVTDTIFSEYYGFTKTEVESLINQAPQLENRGIVLDNITTWYNGYQTGPHRIFNPWSVRACLLERGAINTYWKNTASFSDSYTTQAIADEELRYDIELMMSMNGTVSLPLINKPFGYWNLNNTKASLSLLLHKGLLTTNSVSTDGRTVLRYSIPNREARSIIYHEILHYELEKLGIFNENLPMGCKNPVRYLAEGKIALFENNTQILLDTYCTASTIKSAESFHWLMEALTLPALHDRYNLVSERNSDLTGTFWRFIPMSRADCVHLPVVILGYQYVDDQSKLISACKRAINQIISKNYIGSIGVGNRTIYYVGASVSSKKHFKAMYASPLRNGTLFIESNANEEITDKGENKG